MQAWRGMAQADGYSVPRRWRWYVRAVAKQKGYTFTDGFLSTVYYEVGLQCQDHLAGVFERCAHCLTPPCLRRCHTAR
jgi:hypothetical protein